ncbi:hydrogenase expression protein [Psychromonas sp. psych-6C06]|uniref:ABC transporter ATP-binding protein n=1 Tax=Psychromonas sp. psych-6C06 TaxID=2058089 RepID=UPI000C33853F|nr:ABC transporter ATP-binding protein [Psychromonas sp. psych-6C06]PKF61004.1 hydrogenase expression protein [Psychromonas sp. psych-6C06]
MTSAVGFNIENGQLRYSDAKQAIIDNLSLTILPSQWTAILGKSGCGKTTILRYLAGLLPDKIQWQGTLTVKGLQSSAGKLENHVAYMAQQDLLMPWLTVFDNVCFSTKFSNKPLSDNDKNRAKQLLDLVGLKDHAQKRPAQLSGGMRQRVALARTLMQDKPLVLMDEPFSALDAVTRYRLQALSARLLANKTVLLITHDPQEALRLSNSVYIMQGKPAQATPLILPNTATPRDLDAPGLASLQQQIISLLEVDYE